MHKFLFCRCWHSHYCLSDFFCGFVSDAFISSAFLQPATKNNCAPTQQTNNEIWIIFSFLFKQIWNGEIKSSLWFDADDRVVNSALIISPFPSWLFFKVSGSSNFLLPFRSWVNHIAAIQQVICTEYDLNFTFKYFLRNLQIKFVPAPLPVVGNCRNSFFHLPIDNLRRNRPRLCSHRFGYTARLA